MNSYIDAILHIADLPGLAAAIAVVAPGMLDPDSGAITGFAATPAVRNGAAALVYVRMTGPEAAQWRGTPGVIVLAEHAYTGPETPDEVYARLFADPASLALYDAVYSRAPLDAGDGATWTPPERFGQLG